jgi:predicted nucleic acid-binding protein
MPAVNHASWSPGSVYAGPIYVDASVALAALVQTDRIHASATQFVIDNAAVNVELQVSLLCLDEVIYKLLQIYIASTLGVTRRQVSVGQTGKDHPSRVTAEMPKVEQAISSLLKVATVVDGRESPPTQILDEWLAYERVHGFQRDAWHLAIAENAGSQTFVTGDRDFRRVLVTSRRPLSVVQI